MANVYHWLTGSQTDLYSGIFLTASYGAQVVANSSRYGSGSAWEIGTSTSSRATLYSGYNASGPDALPNLGTGDITIAFWWQPNNSSYGGGGQRHLFQYSPGAVVEVYHSADLSSDVQNDYNLYAKFRYGNGTPSKSKAFDIDLTGNPWIKVYASRISGAFYYTLFDATGSVITDNDGNLATWSDTTQTGNIYEASSSTPHIRIGGDFASGQTAGGLYDDIFLTLNHGIGTGSLETDSDGYAKIDPVINSFSTSATSATSGSSVTLSWDVDFGTTLQLLKYVGGLLTNTETVTDTSSKSVTITQTVSYKIRATNIYGSVDSSSVEITLNGGNSMPGTMVSGSAAIPYQLHAGVLGGFVSGSSAGQFQAIPVEGLSAATADRVAGRALHSAFAGSSGSIISALNFLQSEGDFTAGNGISQTALDADVISLNSNATSFQFSSGELQLSGAVAGDGLTLSSHALAVSVDDSSIEISGDSLQVKAAGVTNAMLAGSIANAKLANSTISGVALGTNLNALTAASKGGVAVSSYNGSAAVSDLALDIDGMDEIGADLTAADTFAVDDGDGGTNKKATVERIGDFVGSGADFSVSGGVLSLAANSVGVAEVSTAVAGSGLSGGGGSALAVSVDDSSIEIDSDSLQIKAAGVTNAMLAGSIANAKLANSTISGVALGTNLNALTAASKGGVALTSYNGSAAVSNLALDIDGMDEIGADLNKSDTFAVDDGDGGTNKKATVERIGAFVGSGDDFGVSDGVLSIAASRVGATEIVAKGVGTAELQDAAVASGKILAASVISDKLAPSIHRTAAGENMVFDANGTDNTGLYFLGTDSSGATARFQVVVQGGMLQLKTGMAEPTESSAVDTAAGGANAS